MLMPMRWKSLLSRLRRCPFSGGFSANYCLDFWDHHKSTLPSKWRKIVRNTVLVDLLEQPLRELLFFSRPLCLRAVDGHSGSFLANSNSWKTCTGSEL